MAFHSFRGTFHALAASAALALAGCGGSNQAQMPENPKPKPPEGGFKAEGTTTPPAGGQGNAPAGADAPGGKSSTLPAPPPVTLPE
jgi:hypothetical protein